MGTTPEQAKVPWQSTDFPLLESFNFTLKTETFHRMRLLGISYREIYRELMSDYLKTPGFCVAPFVHSCIWTDGRVIPCCINQDVVFGDAKSEDLNAIYSNNNKKLISFRKELLSGKAPKSCERCTKPEQDHGAESYRLWLNKKFGHVINDIKINANGTIDEQKFAYYDVRFSNLCTLKCRMCDHINSSAIASEENNFLKAGHKVLREPFEDFEEFSRFFVKNIDSVENMYFCGGEPLILEYHYKLLQLLIDHGKTDVFLKYNSNCTSIRFRDKKITDYWKKFPNICLGMSLDDTGQRAEFIRDGSNWQTILENLREIRKECPHVSLEWTPTIQIMNVMTIPKLHLELLKEGLVDLWYYIILTDPSFYSIQALTPELKQEVLATWDNYRKNLMKLDKTPMQLKLAEDVMSFMMKIDKTSLLPAFRKETLSKDKMRKQSFSEIFPHLKKLMEA